MTCIRLPSDFYSYSTVVDLLFIKCLVGLTTQLTDCYLHHLQVLKHPSTLGDRTITFTIPQNKNKLDDDYGYSRVSRISKDNFFFSLEELLFHKRANQTNKIKIVYFSLTAIV